MERVRDFPGGRTPFSSYLNAHVEWKMHLVLFKGILTIKGVSMNMSIRQPQGKSIGLLILFAIVLSGCMSDEPKPDLSMSQARTAVDQADRAGARTYAAFELNKSHVKLQKAEENMKKGDYKKAGYLAKEAKVDAELAIAKTQEETARVAETELRKSREALKNELNNSGYEAQ